MSSSLPRISIVTPSFNQAAFLEETLRSVLDQNYPNLEYIVVDGGSTDGSTEILRKYAPRLAYCVSEKDAGHYDALNKGFARCTGDVMAWLNSDDKYTPWSLSVVGEIFSTFPQIEWATSLFPLYWDATGRAVSCGQMDGFSREGFFRGENLPRFGWYTQGSIQQESTFWRRSLWEKSGGLLDTAYPLAADFNLWARFFQHAELYGIGTPLGGFRMHPTQKTALHSKQYAEQARGAFEHHGGRPPSRIRSFFISKLASLIRGLQRVHERRLQTFPAAHRCLHRRRDGGWQIKTP